MDTVKTPNPRLRNAIIRTVAALLIGLILLAITGFSVISLIRGPIPTDDIQANAQGDFVSRDIYAILGFYGDDASTGENVAGRYSVVPMGNMLVTVQFSDRYLDNAGAVCTSTYDFVNGKIPALDSYVTVQGTVSTLSDKQKGTMYDWFDLNKEQLVEMRMVTDTSDYATILSDQVLLVDTVNGRSQALVFVLSAIAALCLLWAVVELILMACGRYLKKDDSDEGEFDDEDPVCRCDECLAEAEAAEATDTDAVEADGEVEVVDAEIVEAPEAEISDSDAPEVLDAEIIEAEVVEAPEATDDENPERD